MSTWRQRAFVLALLVGGVGMLAASPDEPATPPAAGDLEGLWVAKRRFGPDARGPLLLRESGGSYVAEIAGRVVPVRSRPPEA